MSEQQQAERLAVVKTVTVKAPPDTAFRAFTDGINRWWPLESHHIGAATAVEAVIEPRAGGRWFERAGDGSECDWGRVLAWEPPRRLLLTWEISADWKHDPGVSSEVEVRFVAAPDGGTVVELEHRGLEAFGERAAEMRDTFASPGGWSALLEAYAAAAA
jgi:uncharacterized protein YndB with AHSA1/START domain